jgi:hypothetical protein
MPTGKKKKKPAKKHASGTKKRYIPSVANQLRTGMPAIDSVQEVVQAESPEGHKFEIIRTNERDAYDPPPKPKNKK